MKKMLNTKYGWIGLLLLLVLINYAASIFHFRLDLTEEKRYTLSQPTRKLLSNLDEQVDVTVFLSGDLPASFLKLRNTTEELLQNFKEIGKSKIRFSFEKPGEGLADSAKTYFLDSLARLGIKPYSIQAQVKEGEEVKQVVPGAVLHYKDRVMAINLLSGQNTSLDEGSINRVEATLEYKFANTISKLTTDTVPLIGYLVGNGEPLSYTVYDFIENVLRKNFAFRILPIDSVPAIPKAFSAIVIEKPTQAFTVEQKMKLDQYVMHGGKLLWMIDNLYAEMDSLQRTQNEFIAFERGLQVEDLLFKYGVRVNLDLVQSIASDRIPSVIGNVGDKPQIELVQWPYFPLLTNTTGHPIAKNLDYVVAQFPNSIDTVKADGIRKTILLSTAADSRILSTPARVAWNSVSREEDLKTFKLQNVPVAVLLEGQFKSLYANRATPEQRNAFAAAGSPFAATSPDTKMIVVADGDIALNAVSQNDGPLPLGMNMYSKYTYANKEFLTNALEYLTDNSGILETRSKDFTLRLLDKKKLDEDRTTWQLINIVAPVVLVIIFGALYQYLRKQKYQG